jgi:hypothetical protein
MIRLLAAAGIALAACAPLQGRPFATITLGDVTTAQALAVAGGDTQGASCWGAQLPVIQAFMTGKEIGVATAVEVYRIALQQAQGPCGPIMIPVITRLAPLLAAAGVVVPGL